MTRTRKKSAVDRKAPLADSAPRIVLMMRAIVHGDTSAAREEIHSILSAWDANEDIEELRDLLGLRQHPKRRRKQITVNRDFQIAFAVAEQRARRAQRPLDLVAEEFAVDRRTVERALTAWGPIGELRVRFIRENHPVTRIEYDTN